MVVTRAKAARMAAGESDEDEFVAKPSPTPKRRKVTTRPKKSIEAKLQSIHDYMVENGADFPSKQVQQMLIAPLVFILGEGSAADERCEDVKVLIGMVKDRLAASVERKETLADASNASVTSAESEEEEIIAGLRSSQAKSLAQSNKMSEIADSLQADRQSEFDAEEALSKAQKEVEGFDATQAAMKEAKPVCEETITTFKTLMDTDWGKAKEEMKATLWIKSKKKKEMTAHLNLLVEYLKELNAEESLLQTVPHVFSQKAEDRGMFGKLALDKVEGMLNGRLQEIENRLTNGEKLKQELIAAAAVAEEKLEEATKNKKLRERDLEQAEADFMDCKTEEKEANKTKANNAKLMKRLKRDRDVMNKEHQKALQVMSHFMSLHDRHSTTPLEEPEDAAGEEDDTAGD